MAMILGTKTMLQEQGDDGDTEEDLINMIEIGKMKKHMKVEVLLKTLQAPIPMLLIMLPPKSSAPIEVVATNVAAVETQITEATIEEEEEDVVPEMVM